VRNLLPRAEPLKENLGSIYLANWKSGFPNAVIDDEKQSEVRSL